MTDAPHKDKEHLKPIPNEDETSRSGWREFSSTLAILGVALLTALFIIAFVFRSYEVDGPSMQNTLQNTDKLIIWKVPRSWARLTHHNYIPKRGDIVVFDQTGLSEFGDRSDKKQLIKRVIGLPGDRIVVSDGAVTVYNKTNPKGFDPDITLGYGGKDFPTTSSNIDKTLNDKQIFVMGDNRVESLDSRAFGPIQANQIIGKLVLRVFPLGDAKTF